jgi:hypothetical protein
MREIRDRRTFVRFPKSPSNRPRNVRLPQIPTYTYDGSGRTVTAVKPDGSTTSYLYSGTLGDTGDSLGGQWVGDSGDSLKRPHCPAHCHAPVGQSGDAERHLFVGIWDGHFSDFQKAPPTDREMSVCRGFQPTPTTVPAALSNPSSPTAAPRPTCIPATTTPPPTRPASGKPSPATPSAT